jgi:hypothetical protein
MLRTKSRGSGVFAALVGLLFVGALWNPRGIDFVNLNPIHLIRVWFGFAALILLTWGIYRAIRPDAETPLVGQDTLNFVVAIIGATFAILGFLTKK